jgi:CopG family nickel-responsive transcriptional regulator
MSKLKRISFSMEGALHEAFRRRARERGYMNLSKFFADLVRADLVGKEWADDRLCLGTITILYDHNRRAVSDRLTKLQHEQFHAILAATHVHLDHDLCAEAILVRARASRIRALSDVLARQKGVLHATLSLSSSGRGLPAAGHSHD